MSTFFSNPALQLNEFLHYVAQGKRNLICQLLSNNTTTTQILLKTSGTFTDYSGRTFECSAYEYAWWAKDKHMIKLLESYMDNETKTIIDSKIIDQEKNGLLHTQHGKKLDSRYFSITPLKKAYCAYISATRSLEQELNFNKSMDAVIRFNKKIQQRNVLWKKVGMLQRNLPVHYVNECLRKDRSFEPLPDFNEPDLPSESAIYNPQTNRYEELYPLPETTGLGFDFTFRRTNNTSTVCYPIPIGAIRSQEPSSWVVAWDLTAIALLDEVRTNDLVQLRYKLKELRSSKSSLSTDNGCSIYSL